MDNQVNINSGAVSNRFNILRVIGVLMMLVGLGLLYPVAIILISPLRSILVQEEFLLKVILPGFIFGILYVIFGVLVYKNKFLKLSMLIQLTFIVFFYFFQFRRMPIEMLLSAIFFIILAFQLKAQKSIKNGN